MNDTVLREALKREFGEAVVLDAGFSHEPPAGWWEDRAKALRAALAATPPTSAERERDERGREICDLSYLCPHHTGRRTTPPVSAKPRCATCGKTDSWMHSDPATCLDERPCDHPNEHHPFTTAPAPASAIEEPEYPDHTP